jgi:hypothetical protein
LLRLERLSLCRNLLQLVHQAELRIALGERADYISLQRIERTNIEKDDYQRSGSEAN